MRAWVAVVLLLSSPAAVQTSEEQARRPRSGPTR